MIPQFKLPLLLPTSTKLATKTRGPMICSQRLKMKKKKPKKTQISKLSSKNINKMYKQSAVFDKNSSECLTAAGSYF